MAQPKPFALKATITLFLLWLVALSANAQTYYQAPYTGTGAPCVARTDLSGLPLNNDDPGLISTKELINEARPGATGDSTRDQSYLQVSNVEPLDHRCIGSQCGATQLSFTLPFRRKISYNISLIFETQAIRFHGYLRGAAWWVGTPDTWPALPDYEVYPDFSQFCRVWNTGHSTQHNMSVRVLLPWPNSFQLGDYTTILIDDQYGGGRNRMWVIAD